MISGQKQQQKEEKMGKNEKSSCSRDFPRIHPWPRRRERWRVETQHTTYIVRSTIFYIFLFISPYNTQPVYIARRRFSMTRRVDGKSEWETIELSFFFGLSCCAGVVVGQDAPVVCIPRSLSLSLSPLYSHLNIEYSGVVEYEG